MHTNEHVRRVHACVQTWPTVSHPGVGTQHLRIAVTILAAQVHRVTHMLGATVLREHTLHMGIQVCGTTQEVHMHVHTALTLYHSIQTTVES